jgi:hypothetical protein
VLVRSWISSTALGRNWAGVTRDMVWISSSIKRTIMTQKIADAQRLCCIGHTWLSDSGAGTVYVRRYGIFILWRTCRQLWLLTWPFF